MSIQGNLQQILTELPTNVSLVAVSKFHPNEAIEEAYQAGQRIFGESRAQELKAKHETLPQDIEWHFIGSLQANKIKYMVSYVALIHSIDSYRLLEEVNKHAAKVGRVVNCLLQLHIAQEDTKSGFTYEECKQMLAEGQWRQLGNIRICGLMGMATFTDDKEQISAEFRLLSSFYKEVKTEYFADDNAFCELSMGMSDDYLLAMQYGSTLVRIGSRIFGNRY
ncbi:YggS family pyridoxal phosphate-dependent enzyme [Bacteroides sp. OttesenSCG-928-N06]|nr:YggS family pyridoxal phosphate-dependent enzyme [Bacteroides sp. OttesenSCG-928-N06]